MARDWSSDVCSSDLQLAKQPNSGRASRLDAELAPTGKGK
jgi:hypothetical protein